MKILFITRINIQDKKSTDGGLVVSIQNYKMLCNIASSVHVVNCNPDEDIFIPYPFSLKNKIVSYLQGELSFNPMKMRGLKKWISRQKFDVIFYDNSIFGGLIPFFRKVSPLSKHVTFFHNVEVDYLKSIMQVKGKQYALKYPLLKKAEKTACCLSDAVISLNQRDSDRLFVLYNRKADLILPVTMTDKFEEEMFSRYTSTIFKGLLFLGSAFHANIDGLSWFVKNVIPHIKVPLTVVGKNFENYKDKFEKKNVTVIGTVVSLSEYLYDNYVLVEPIFIGSGMKVKTAEALMYGKTIMGTKEAFEGYQIKHGKEGYICNTAEEFIEKIDKLEKHKNYYNTHAREYFLRNHDTTVLCNKLKLFLEKL